MTDSTTPMTSARKLALWSIGIQAVTLWMKVGDAGNFAMMTITPDWNCGTNIWFPPDQSGISLHPMGPVVYAWLAFMFFSKKYDGWWSKHGFKVAVVAMFLTTGGGQCLGGIMNVAAFWLMVYAAWRRHKELKLATADGVVPPPSAVADTAAATSASSEAAAASLPSSLTAATTEVTAPKRVRKSPVKKADSEAPETAPKKRKSATKEESVAPAEKEPELAAKTMRKRKSTAAPPADPKNVSTDE